MNVHIKHNPLRSRRANTALRLFALTIGVVLIALAFSNDVRITGGPGFGLAQMLLLGAGLVNVLAGALGGGLLKVWVLCQLSVGATLGLAELAVQATLSHRYLSPYQLDDRYLYKLVPGALREHRHMPINGGTQLYRVNSLGFRGEDFQATRSATPRIVIYGDSFIHAEYTALEHTLVRQLEEQLTVKLGRPVEVINAGVAGYGPDQVLRRVEDELEWLQPDLLIVGIFAGNDFGDLLRNKLYRLDPDGELLHNNYTFGEEVVLNAALETSEPVLRKVGREAKNQLQALLRGVPGPTTAPAQLTYNRLQQHLREFQEYVIEGDNEVRDLRTDPYSADIAVLPGSPSAEYKLALMDAVVAGIHRQAQAQGVPLLLLAIPHPMDVMGGEHASGAVDMNQFPDYLPSRMTDAVQAIAERQAIDYLNLYPHFRDAPDPAGLYLRGGDDHWNNAGQALAAELIAGHVLTRGYVPPTALPESEPAAVLR